MFLDIINTPKDISHEPTEISNMSLDIRNQLKDKGIIYRHKLPESRLN